MPHTKKVKSTLPKGARALKSSTPKRPATSLPPPPTTSPSEFENPKRNKTHVSPKFALPSSKSRPSTSNLLKDRAQKPTTTTKTLVSKTSTVHKSKTSTSTTTTKQKALLYSIVASLPPSRSTSRHSSQAPSQQAPVISNPIPVAGSPRPTPIPAPRASLFAPSSTPQPTQDTRTNSFYIHFDLKYWKSEKEDLIALNNEYPTLQFDIKGKLGHSFTTSVPKVENFTVFASLTQQAHFLCPQAALYPLHPVSNFGCPHYCLD